MSSGKPKERTETIQYIGVSDLRIPEQETVHKITEEYAQKFKHTASEFEQIIVHVKVYNAEGARRKYSVHIRVLNPKHSFESKTDDWDLSPVLHQGFEDIIKRLDVREQVERHERVYAAPVKFY